MGCLTNGGQCVTLTLWLLAYAVPAAGHLTAYTLPYSLHTCLNANQAPTDKKGANTISKTLQNVRLVLTLYGAHISKHIFAFSNIYLEVQLSMLRKYNLSLFSSTDEQQSYTILFMFVYHSMSNLPVITYDVNSSVF